MRTIRASEISAYLYCQRAWWYQKRGTPSENQPELLAGSELHRRHGSAVMRLSCLRFLAYFLLVVSLVLLVIHFTQQLL